MAEKFRIGLSGDFRTKATGLMDPFLKEVLDPLPHVSYDYFDCGDEVEADNIKEYDAIISLATGYSKASLRGVEQVAIISRWGVGYDMVDVPACTEADILVAITTDGVRRPVAEAILTLLLALSKKLPENDKIVRQSRWDLKLEASGIGLRGKTMGSLGVGNIGGEMFKLLKPFDLGGYLAHDPYISQEKASEMGVELVDLKTLFKESDFIAVNCPLTDGTEGMVNAECFSVMKPTAYIINTARGPIINEADLIAALEDGKIAGAGLDVFEQEPLPKDSPLIGMENVLLAPHGLAWTDDLYRGLGVEVCENALTVLRGEVPQYTVNKEVSDRSGFKAKLASLKERWEALAG